MCAASVKKATRREKRKKNRDGGSRQQAQDAVARLKPCDLRPHQLNVTTTITKNENNSNNNNNRINMSK